MLDLALTRSFGVQPSFPRRPVLLRACGVAFRARLSSKDAYRAIRQTLSRAVVARNVPCTTRMSCAGRGKAATHESAGMRHGIFGSAKGVPAARESQRPASRSTSACSGSRKSKRDPRLPRVSQRQRRSPGLLPAGSVASHQLPDNRGIVTPACNARAGTRFASHSAIHSVQFENWRVWISQNQSAHPSRSTSIQRRSPRDIACTVNGKRRRSFQ